MAWERELEELAKRQADALAMGGPERIERQHSLGKLTARERLELLLDPDSFREFGQLAGTGVYQDDQLVQLIPKGSVDGHGTVDGRPVVVSAGDVTSRGTGAHMGGIGSEPSPARRSLEWRIPHVRLLDSVGGSVSTFDELGRTYLPDGNTFSQHEVQLLQVVPTVSALLGAVAGLPAVHACLSHFTVMVRGTSQIFPGGPPVVKAALGMDIDKEALGGADVHTRVSGVIDNVAETEEEALQQLRAVLSYLPTSVDELPPVAVGATPALPPDALRDVVAENRRQPYDVHRLLDAVLDEGSLFEIAPGYGCSRVTGLARVDGHPIGVMANDPRALGGATDVAAGQKVIRLVQLCDLFHLPLVSFADEPGFLPGPDSERAGIERAGAALVWTICTSRMPWCTFVVGRLFGVGGQCHHRPTGMYRRYAWPSATWGSMHIAGGAAAAFRKEIEAAPDPAAMLAQIERRLEALASPFRTAEATFQDIIDPVETRARLVEFVHDAQRVLATQLGPSPLPYRP